MKIDPIHTIFKLTIDPIDPILPPVSTVLHSETIPLKAVPLTGQGQGGAIKMNQNQNNAGLGNFLNGVMAFGITALLAPWIFDFAAPYVLPIVTSHYGREAAWVGMLGTAIFVGVFTYAAANRGVVIVATVIVTAIGRFIWRQRF